MSEDTQAGGRGLRYTKLAGVSADILIDDERKLQSYFTHSVPKGSLSRSVCGAEDR